jgi:hypothetical protein
MAIAQSIIDNSEHPADWGFIGEARLLRKSNLRETCSKTMEIRGQLG